MKPTALLACLLVLALGVLALRGLAGAEPEPAADPVQSAQAAFDAWRAGDYEKFHGMLASDVKGEIGLLNLEMRKELGRMDLSDREVANPLMERLALMDPEGVLRLTAPERLKMLSDAEFFGLASGLLAVSKQLRLHPEDRWAMVEFLRGLRPPVHGLHRDSMVEGSFARFESVALGKLEMWFVRDGGHWRVDLFELSRPGNKVSLTDFLKDGASYDVRWPGVSPQEDRLQEGETLLMDVYRKCRASYLGRRSEGDAVERFESLKKEGKLDGGSYTVTDIHTGLARNAARGALVAKPKTDGDAWLMLLIEWDTGQVKFLDQETEDSIKERLDKMN